MATLKKLLPDVITEIFRNWDDTGNEVKAVGFNFCNVSDSPCKVYVSFAELSGDFYTGAIYSGLTISAHSSIYKEIPARFIAMDEAIFAYAETADVIAFTVDLIGVDQGLIPTDPA